MAALLTTEMVYGALVQVYESAGYQPVDRVRIVMYLSTNGHNDNWTGSLEDRVQTLLRQLVQDGRAIQTWPDGRYAPKFTLPKAPPNFFVPPMHRPDFFEPRMPPGFSPTYPDYYLRPQHPLNEPFGRMVPPEPDHMMPPKPGSKPDYGSLLAQPERTSTKGKPRPLTDDEAEERDDDETESNLSSKTPSKASDSSSTRLTTGASSRTAIDEMPRLFRPLTPDRFQMFVREEKPTKREEASDE